MKLAVNISVSSVISFCIHIIIVFSKYYMNKTMTPRLDVCIEAMALELEIVDPNSTCLDGLGIGVWKLSVIPRGIRFT